MKFSTGLLVTLATMLGMFAGTATASDQNPVGKVTAPSTSLIEVFQEVRHVETKSRKKRKKRTKKSKKSRRQSLVSLRNEATRNTIRDLGRLRPYTTDFNRLKSAVRRYWRRNIAHPSASGLAKTIMRYVKRQDRNLVRNSVYSGVKKGVRKIKRSLKRR